MYETMLHVVPENSIFRAIQDCFVPFWATRKFQNP